MKYKFTKTDRMRIVHEYETSYLTFAELSKKYGPISGLGISTICVKRKGLVVEIIYKKFQCSYCKDMTT